MREAPRSQRSLGAHWRKLYASKAPDTVSWYQPHANRSLRMIRATGVPPDAAIIDVGGGASTLVDDLLDQGYIGISVLDLSEGALAESRKRLGQRADQVCWIVADITSTKLPPNTYDVWHDRAVFHFLTTAPERAAYLTALNRSVKRNGHIIVATFAEDGPTECSGLPVLRYSAHRLSEELGDTFELISHEKESHHTPSGSIQKFNYCWFRKTANTQ